MPSDTMPRLETGRAPPCRAQILNGRFDGLTADQTVEELIRAIRAGERGILSTVNVAILMMMRSSPRLQRFVDGSRWTVADGQPLVWASHLWQQPLPERVAGIDLIDKLCARAVQEEIGVYFLGAEANTVRTAVRVLRRRHRGLDVRGLGRDPLGLFLRVGDRLALQHHPSAEAARRRHLHMRRRLRHRSAALLRAAT